MTLQNIIKDIFKFLFYTSLCIYKFKKEQNELVSATAQLKLI